jgi:hypothetical protein
MTSFARWYSPTACVAMLLTLLGTFTVSAWQELGYQDTPVLPGLPWHVHDGQRPQPPAVSPGERFSEEATAPAGATVLFRGENLDAWQVRDAGDATWTVRDGYFEVKRGAGNIRTRQRFPDFQLHLEFATPEVVRGQGQQRGNSGVLVNGMYEIQLLDSHDNPTYPDGQCGAIYGQTPPLVNASRPPGQWQTYEVIFESPRWNEDGELTQAACATVIHNGLVLHHRREFLGATDGVGGVPHKALAEYKLKHEPEVFIELQDHGNPMRFRNVWIRPLGLYDQS